jgi:hypothetical protein
MATWVIPTRTDLEFYTEQVELGGVVYRLTFAWNLRDSAWYMSIADVDGVAIVSGIRIVVDYPLLNSVSNADRPTGLLLAIDTSGAGLDPGLEDLGDRVLLMHEEA